MSYYKVLGLFKEPFSTSPDPDFFCLTKGHDVALTNLLIELHLRRGISVILGDVGTGKTTLSRKLIQCLQERPDFLVHIILDPYFRNEGLFLDYLVRNFDVETGTPGAWLRKSRTPSVPLMKDALQKYLYDKCLLENKTVVLIVDEAQKLTNSSMEMLRVILNYETNENKMLQVVLLGQLELHSKIMKMPNFSDRISFKFALNPLSVQETADMISFRLRQAGYDAAMPLFRGDAVGLIHEVSQGYPRKTMLLCHRALKAMIMKSRWQVDEEIVREIINEDVRAGWLTPILH